MSGTQPEKDDQLPDLHEDDAEQIIVLDENSAEPRLGDDGDNSDDGQQLDNEGDMQLELEPADANENSERLPTPAKDDAIIVLTDHSSDALAIAASPTNPSYIITGGQDDVGHIWDLELQMSLAKVDGANESVSTVCFSHDGLYAAFGSENGGISIVYMDGSPSPSAPLEGPGDTINSLAWHPRGPILLAASADNVAYMWNAAKGKFLAAFAGHEDAVTCACFSADGKFVITASQDSSLRVWNPTTGETLVRVQMGIPGMRSAFHTADILSLAVGNASTKAEMLVATGCAAGDVFITHRETGHVVTQLPRHNGSVESLAFSPPSLPTVMLASAAADGIVRIWNVENSMERCTFSHGGVIAKVAWHAHLPVLVSGSSDGTIVLWNVLSGQSVVQLSGHESFITDVCFTSDQKRVASTSADCTVRVFDVSTVLASVT